LSKVADFDPPHLYLAPPQGVIPVEFRGDLWHPKTRVPGLSCVCVFVCLILRLAVLVGLRLVTDGQTDGHRAMASTADAEHRAVKTATESLLRTVCGSEFQTAGYWHCPRSMRSRVYETVRCPSVSVPARACSCKPAAVLQVCCCRPDR